MGKFRDNDYSLYTSRLTRSLDGSDEQIKTITQYSDPNLNPNRNKNFDLLLIWAMAIGHAS